MTVVRPGISGSGFRRCALAALLLLVGQLEEGDADLVAVDPGQFAAAIGEAGGRQQQEEFLQMEPLDRSLDRELRTALRDVFHLALAPPGAVDAHHVRGNAALEGDALALATLCRHRVLRPQAAAPAKQARVWRRLSGCRLITGKSTEMAAER